MRVLLTGSSGFVGANLLEGLVDAGHEVHIVLRRQSDTSRISHLLPKIAGSWHADLVDVDTIRSVIENVSPTAVFHLATYGAYPWQTDKSLMVDTNLRGTVHLLDAAVAGGTKYFVNTGSSSEYGIKDHPMEEEEVCEPESFYGVTKLAATNYCRMTGKQTGRRICTLRLFSVYGRYEDPSRLYPSIVGALRDNERPRLSSPVAVRDFIEVEKVVSIYLGILSADFQPGAIFNVGSGKQQTILEFYRKIAGEFGKSHIEPQWGSVSSRGYEPPMWQANIDRLTRVLGRRDR